jgi:hypothetical protein
VTYPSDSTVVAMGRHRRRHGGRGIIKGGPNTESAEEDARRSAEAEEDAMTRILAD